MTFVLLTFDFFQMVLSKLSLIQFGLTFFGVKFLGLFLTGDILYYSDICPFNFQICMFKDNCQFI